MNSQATSVAAWRLHRSAIRARLVYLREIDRTAFWDFCNTICTFRTWRDIRRKSAIPTKADVRQRCRFIARASVGRLSPSGCGVLADNGIAISMDGKGAWRDNVFVERLWRSVKYEEVYLKAYASVGEARASIGRYLDFYNGKRPHSRHGGQTPDRAYFDNLPLAAAA